MKVRIDYPVQGGSSTVELPSIPRVGDFISINGEEERTVRNVVWHVLDYHPEDEPWVQIILKPSDSDYQ